MKAKMIVLSALVMDFGIYPRAKVDSQHVGYMREALRAGHKFPPIIIDRKTKRVIDGFHRLRMYQAELDKNAKIEVIEKTYKTEKELFLDAIRYNADHGRALTSFDRSHAAGIADGLSIDPDAVASAMNMTVERLGELKVSRSATIGTGRAITVPIKRTIRHMAGRKLSKPQHEANRKLGGMNQTFYVNQLITLIENDLLDTDSEELMQRLSKLHELLAGVAVAA